MVATKSKSPQEFASEPILAGVTYRSHSLNRSRLLDGWCRCRRFPVYYNLYLNSVLKPYPIQTISKTAAAPIERIKLLVQNQDEMVCGGLH